MASSDRYHPRPGGQSIKEVFSCFVFFSVALLESWGLGKIVSSCGISRKSPRPLHPPPPSLPFFLAIAATSNSFLSPSRDCSPFLHLFLSPPSLPVPPSPSAGLGQQIAGFSSPAKPPPRRTAVRKEANIEPTPPSEEKRKRCAE